MRRSTLSIVTAAVISLGVLTACTPTESSVETAPMGVAQEIPAPGGADGTVSEDYVGGVAPAAPESSDVRAANVQQEQRSVIRSASTLVSVDDLPTASKQLNGIVLSEGGTILSEYVKSGYQTPPPVYYDSMGGMPAPYYGYEYEQYVDVVFTVPEDNYGETIEKVRGLGDVVSLNQNATDVTMQVVDTEARISAARASVERIEALLGEAQTLDEMLRLEQELTMRQANLESLLSQQASLNSQVAQSTISVRLVPADLLEESGVPVIGEPSLWERVTDAFAAAWSGFVVFIAYTSPMWVLLLIIAGAVWEGVRVSRRRKKRQSVMAEEARKAASQESESNAS